jgi:hypothetical protein
MPEKKEKITHVENKIYKNLVLTHRMHRNQAELYETEVKFIQLMIILTTISVFMVLIMPIGYEISWFIKFGIALLDLFLILYESGFRPEEKLQIHKSIVKQLLPLRNTFAIAISDYVLDRISEEDFLRIRNTVSSKADAIYSSAPQVKRKAVVKAKEETRKYLEKNADYAIKPHK